MTKVILTLIIISLLFSCSSKPEPINYGKDICKHCDMTIAEKNWGAELITVKGKIYKFDSIECLVQYYLQYQDKSELKSLWTVGYNLDNQLIDATTSFYLKSSNFHSPMGYGAASFQNLNDLNKNKSRNDDVVMSWGELIIDIKKGW